MEFKDFGLNPRILDAIEQLGYTTPTPVQEQAIPPAVLGRDVLGCAQTGTGKTAAFALPILHNLSQQNNPNRAIRALILTPTRELALQIEQSFRDYGKFLKLQCAVIMGGVGQGSQISRLSRGVDILIATPGRLLDLYNQNKIKLSALNFFVLDEADRMLDMGFIHDVRKIIALIPEKRQTMFFTATLPPEIIKLTKTLLVDPVEVSVTPVSSTVDAIEQTVYLTDKTSKPDLLCHLMQNELKGSALIFTRTKYGADKLVRSLKRAGIEGMAIHGDKSQSARQNALNSFKAGKIRALVATDIAARGIDIDSLPNVINYDLPNVPETYVHRIGRTGRAGKDGRAVSLCDIDEKEYLRDIQKLIKREITQVESPFPMTVFDKSPTKQKSSSRNQRKNSVRSYPRYSQKR